MTQQLPTMGADNDEATHSPGDERMHIDPKPFAVTTPSGAPDLRASAKAFDAGTEAKAAQMQGVIDVNKFILKGLEKLRSFSAPSASRNPIVNELQKASAGVDDAFLASDVRKYERAIAKAERELDAYVREAKHNPFRAELIALKNRRG